MPKFILLAVLLPAICLTGIFFQQEPSGQTLESRETILRALPKGFAWNISSEIEVGDHIVSAITTSDLDGLAVFAPTSNGGYECYSTSYRDKGEIVIETLHASGRNYCISWLNRPELDYVEFEIGTMAASENIRIGVQDLLPVYVDVPAVDYTLHVSYYTTDGTCIE